MPNPLLVKLVGNHFRADGRQLLPLLPEGQPLALEPEPSNPYDSDAVMVMVDVSSPEWHNQGWGGVVHLGYVPRSRGNNIGTLQVLNILNDPNTDYRAELTFDLRGEPLVRITTL